TLMAAGFLRVDADSDHSATPDVVGFAASLGAAVSVIDATAIISGATRAYIDGNSTVNAANDTNVTADSLAHALPDGDSIAVGLAAGGAAAIMDAQVNRVTEAYVGRRASGPAPLTTTVLNIGAHKLNVLAGSTYEARTDSLAAGFGLLAGASVIESTASV